MTFFGGKVMNVLGVFGHSFRQVFGNWRQTLRISALLLLIMIIGQQWLIESVMQAGASQHQSFEKSLFIVVFNTFILPIPLIIAAVNWHRFILLGERVGWLPRIHLRRDVSYFWRGIVITLCAMAMMVLGAAIVFLFALAAQEIIPNQTAEAVLLAVVGLAFFIALYAFMLRLGVSLPGAAIGGATIRDSWRATRGHWRGFALLTLLAFLVVLPFVAVSMLSIQAPHDLADDMVVVALKLLFAVPTVMLLLSILTTLYGHFVEQRALV
ncbi:hypothetical protein BMI86_11965 [Thioclava sp. DLFJ5-1]|uniref:hypothetical protein n=1 Tax=Thioclava sp. DLFJ5-1 TaxID=1915314 RepID=UPI0009D1FA5C|nr:hypothetical protein [Thioclava sp. DLFJ5-1]OOY20164.1 hypothetical protein BMI86_11965 [Thioclava sp. DLFJ5-1]